MSAEEEHAPLQPSSEQPEDWPGETLTDLIDRMDREAFRRRVLEQRHPRPPADEERPQRPN